MSRKVEISAEIIEHAFQQMEQVFCLNHDINRKMTSMPQPTNDYDYDYDYDFKRQRQPTTVLFKSSNRCALCQHYNSVQFVYFL